MSAFTIRPARIEDKEAVLAFTEKTWDWGDYIQYVWDDWLAAGNAQLTVAEAGGQPVAITMTTLLQPGEGWLQGLRVHPDFRRQGLARELTAYQLDWLRQRGAAVVRLAVHCYNLASQTHVAHVGFRRAATFGVIEQALKTAVGSDLSAEAVPPAEAGTAWAALTYSSTWRAAAGLWARGWAWLRLTRDILMERCRQGQVCGVREGGQWSALAIAYLDDDSYHIGYVDGSGPALEHLARALTRRAQQAGAEFNVAILPPVPHVWAAFRRAGYSAAQDGAAMYIYEMGL